jgi:hypothetical protein
MSEIKPGIFDDRNEAETASPDHRLMELAREIMQERGCSWDEAWNMALDENPELKTWWTKFLHKPSARGHIDLIPPQKLRTESSDVAAKEARARKCGEVVRAIQVADPDLSFEESWRIAAARDRELFEGGAAGDFQSRCEVLIAKCDALLERRDNSSDAVKVVSIRPKI